MIFAHIWLYLVAEGTRSPLVVIHRLSGGNRERFLRNNWLYLNHICICIVFVFVFMFMFVCVPFFLLFCIWCVYCVYPHCESVVYLVPWEPTSFPWVKGFYCLTNRICLLLSFQYVFVLQLYLYLYDIYICICIFWSISFEFRGFGPHKLNFSSFKFLDHLFLQSVCFWHIIFWHLVKSIWLTIDQPLGWKCW